jgi:Coenzyme PQQ synthesis protein D (PqqD)
MNSSLVRRSANQIACDMGDETVILDLVSGTYYGLDVVAARVWALIEEPMPLRVIHQTIVSEYDVDADNCERDIVAFLDRMRTIGLVELSDGAAV